MRNIDDELYGRLKARAARSGVSMEEEVRRILKRATSAPERLGTFAKQCFENSSIEFETPTRETYEPLDFR